MKGSPLALYAQVWLPVLWLSQAAGATELPSDAPHGAFAFRRPVELAAAPADESAAASERAGERPNGRPNERQGFAALPLPPELAGSGAASYADLRLVRSDGREVPYLIEVQGERHQVTISDGQLADARSENGRSSWLVDLLAPTPFDAVELQIADTYFAKQVKIESASERGGPYRVLQAGAGVFDRPWLSGPGWRVRHTSVEWDTVHKARYLRVTVDDTRSRPIELRGVQVLHHQATPAQMWTRPAPLVELAATGGPHPGRHAPPDRRHRYRLNLPPGLPIEQVLVRASELALVRPVRLIEETLGSVPGTWDERELARDTLYRLAAAAPAPAAGKRRPIDDSRIDAALAAEWMTLRLAEPPGSGTLVLEIDDGDNPPLQDLQVEVYGCGARLLFEYPAAGSAQKWALYYGNKAARAPHYDLEALRERLTQLGSLRPARLLGEQANPRYQPAPPLSFVPTVGAPLQSDAFRLQRALRVEGSPDIYAVTLSPVDLGLLRPDLGDVRIVDSQDRQVPYVLSADEGEARAELLQAADPSPPPRRSRWRLRFAADEAPQPLALPLLAVELSIRDSFYRRDFRLLQAAEGEPGAPRLLYAGTLQRQGEEPTAPHSLPLHGDRVRELILEIDDQDNPPLTLVHARGVLRAPRLAFKLAPGEGYRLLLGNPEVAPPQYDIETLRQAVLSYNALPAQLDRLQQNRSYRARSSDYLLHAPPTALLWGSLLVAVAVLLLITIRLLGKAPAPPAEE